MKLTHVSFAYGDKVILDHFSLELPDEGITALAGPSGCGKTTLLRLLAGLETAQSGTIDAPADTALLFQEDRLLPGLTAAGQIGVVLPRGESSAPWLETVGLAGASTLLPEELSGGMVGGQPGQVALSRCPQQVLAGVQAAAKGVAVGVKVGEREKSHGGVLLLMMFVALFQYSMILESIKNKTFVLFL